MDTESEFIEAMGLVMQQDGMPRIAGRLLAVFVLNGGPFSFGELAERLQVSRGSVSTNTRLLEGLGVIERVARPGERQDFFRLADAPYAQMIERKGHRARRALETVESTASELARADTDVRGRLAELAHFYRVISDATSRAISLVRDVPPLDGPKVAATQSAVAACEGTRIDASTDSVSSSVQDHSTVTLGPAEAS